MKFVLLICFALASPAIAADDALTADLMDFVNLLDEEAVIEVLMKYVENPEFLALLDYVSNEQEFKDILVSFEKIPEYVELLNFLDNAGLDVYGALNDLYEAVGLPPPSIPKSVGLYQPRAVMHDMLEEIAQLFPKAEIKALHEEKLKTSAVFKYFSDRITSPQAEVLFDDLTNQPDFAKSMSALQENGLDVYGYIAFSAELFGFM